MERGIGITKLSCEATTHVSIIDGRVLRLRCTHNACPDVIDAKARGHREIVIHCWDLQNIANSWTEFEAPYRRKKEK